MTDLDEARRLLAAGYRAAAQRSLRALLRADPQRGDAWWLLAAASDDPVAVAESRQRAQQLGTPPPADLAALEHLRPTEPATSAPRAQLPPSDPPPTPPPAGGVPWPALPPANPTPQQPRPVTPPGPPPAPLAGEVTIAGAIVALLGALLPWIILHQGGQERLLNLWNGRMVVMGGSAALLVVGISLRTRGSILLRLAGWVLGVLTGLAGGVLLAYALFVTSVQAGRAERGMHGADAARLVLGSGPYLILLGLLLVLVGCSLPARVRRDEMFRRRR